MGDVWTTPTIASSKRAGAALPMGQGDAGDGPGFLDSVGLGWQRARAAPDWGFNQRNYEEQIAFDLYKGLLEKGYVTRPLDDSLTARIGRTFRGREDPFWSALAKARADGVKLPHAEVLDARSMTAEALRLRRADMEQADARLANGSTLGALGGELLAGLADPTSYIPVGGAQIKGAGLARSILTMGRNEAIANLSLGIAMEPLVRDDAAALGVTRTATDTAADLAVQTAAGFVLGGLGGAVEHVLGGRAARAPTSDDALVSEFDQLIPPQRRTGEEQAAVSVLEQASAERRLSPFVPGPAGDDMHAERMIRARDWAFGVRLPPPQPVRRVGVEEIATGATGNVRHGERARYKAIVRGAESGGNDRANASTSSAYGRYQPLKSTWLNWFQQRYPGSGLTPEQIYAKRADGALQEIFMDDFTAANARALRAAGLPETADNLYLAHFLGASDAVKLLGAAPDTPVAGLVRGKSISANRSILEGKSAGEVRAWAARKMGGDGGQIDVAAAALAEALDDAPLTRPRAESDPWARMTDELPPEGWIEDVDMPRLRPELFTTPEAHARAQIAMEADVDAQEGFDVVARWTDADEAASGDAVKVRREKPRGPLDLMQFIASKGGIRDDERHDLAGMLDGRAYQWGIGNVVRPRGLPIDEMRELAVEAGYFGDPQRTDITVADLLDAIDRHHRSGARAYAGADLTEVEARRRRAEQDSAFPEFEQRLRDVAGERGIETLSEDDVLRALDLWDGESFDRTLDRLIAERLNEAQMDPAAEADAFRWTDPGDYFAPAPAGEGAVDAADLAPWDDPDGAISDMQLMSMDHDLRMWAAEESDLSFPLEEGGEPRTLADILAEVDEEEAVIAALEACL
ncbi:MAG: hypothetical protein WBL20_07725 [Sphingobium sp.]|uniref:hypothetical protein n=1 Tax=Sphingobium sp. TaxID=1912891 RepID=UPI003BAE99B3